MSSESKELLEIFTSADGVSGDEEEIAELFKIAIEPFVDRVETTPLGSVIATRDGTSGKSIMIAAHMDEVGIMVRYITPDGYIYFVPIGGLDANVLLGQEVRFKDGIVGVIGATPPHLSAPGTVHKIENLWVDIGAKDKKMVEDAGIEIGSYAVINSEPRSIGEYLMAKALDDRAGLVAMIEVMEGIEHWEQLDHTVYIVGTVQEEVGLKGGRGPVEMFDPDVAIAIDVTMASNTPGIPESKAPVKMGKGPVLVIADGAGRGIISSKKLNARIRDIAKEMDIPIQMEVSSGGTTDATMMQMVGHGRAATVLSIPSEYIHSPRSTIHMDDYINLVILLRGILYHL